MTLRDKIEKLRSSSGQPLGQEVKTEVKKSDKHLSHSQVSMFLRCPQQYEFSYMKGIKIPPAGALLQGSTYHKGVELGYKYIIENKQQPSLEFIKDSADAEWNAQLKRSEDVTWGEDKPGDLKDEVIKVVSKYHKEVMPKILPLKVEERETIDVGGIPFIRIRDLITAEGVIDHKLAGKKYSANQIYTDLQSLSYVYPNGGKFEYHVGVKSMAGDIQIIDFSRSKAEVDWWVSLVKKVYASILAGNFPPNPGGFFCNPTWCGYWKLCREGR
jgi:hypothetical protein